MRHDVEHSPTNGLKYMLQPGNPAPSFSLPNQVEQNIALASFKGEKNVVLYFYPKDDTSGCTLEANQFSALIDQFTAANTVVIGVSKETPAKAIRPSLTNTR